MIKSDSVRSKERPGSRSDEEILQLPNKALDLHRIHDSVGRMQRWSIPVILCFLLLLASSVFPLALIAEGPGVQLWKTAGDFFKHGWYLGFAIVLTLCQIALLIRVKPHPDRPRSRRRVWPAIIAGGFCFATIGFSLIFAVSFTIYGDDEYQPFFFFVEEMDRLLPGQFEGLAVAGSLIGFFLMQWVVWALVLRRLANKSAASDRPLDHFVRWLIVGSVAELLIAIPCHIIVRKREDCCAPIFTFWGIATGWAILLMCLGPAILFLIQYRLSKKQPAKELAKDDGP
ncbi:MAG: hypothetical protein AAF585_11565 [Verrucomicrobiota bacterium]